MKLISIEIKKTKNNRATYIVKQKAITSDFNPRNIDSYTIKQLNDYLNDSRTKERSKNLIRKALEKAKETSEEFDNLVNEIDDETKKEIIDDDEMPFSLKWHFI